MKYGIRCSRRSCLVWHSIPRSSRNYCAKTKKQESNGTGSIISTFYWDHGGPLRAVLITGARRSRNRGLISAIFRISSSCCLACWEIWTSTHQGSRLENSVVQISTTETVKASSKIKTMVESRKLDQIGRLGWLLDPKADRRCKLDSIIGYNNTILGHRRLMLCGGESMLTKDPTVPFSPREERGP